MKFYLQDTKNQGLIQIKYIPNRSKSEDYCFLSCTKDAFNISVGKSQTQEDADKYKDKLSYDNECFTICSYGYDKEIKWENVEAIFYLNTSRRHVYQKSYRIILNAPFVVTNRRDKWYDKILALPIEDGRYPEIIINSDYNVSFYTFHSACDKYLNKAITASNYLNDKYGNKVESIRKDANTIVGRPVSGPVKPMGFYEIFDRGNAIQDERLIQYRVRVKNYL